jgi:hypothetical protein
MKTSKPTARDYPQSSYSDTDAKANATTIRGGARGKTQRQASGWNGTLEPANHNGGPYQKNRMSRYHDAADSADRMNRGTANGRPTDE